VEIRIPRGSNELQQVPKLLKCQPGIARDACHRDCIDWIVSRNGQYSATVARDHLLALPDDSGRDLDFADRGAFQLAIDDREVLLDCLLDVLECFRLGGSL
jgi:hypothetical protein